MTKLSQKLDAVSKAKQAYVLARTTLEQRLRDQMREELSNLQTQIDIAVRYAIDSGESKASVMRALGTKDYNTVKASLERTQGVAEVVGADPYQHVYKVVDNILHVTWVDHGAEKYNGVASFNINKLEDGKLIFFGREKLWSEDYKVRNDAIAMLDGQTDGFYYDEVTRWLDGHTA